MEKILILFLQLYSAIYTLARIFLLLLLLDNFEKLKLPEQIKFTAKEAALFAVYWLGAYLWFFNP